MRIARGLVFRSLQRHEPDAVNKELLSRAILEPGCDDKAAQNKYAAHHKTLQELERTKEQLAHKLKSLVAEDAMDKEAKASAHDKALKAYSAAIAAGDKAAEAEADTALQSILG